jgi:hypothetical protein
MNSYQVMTEFNKRVDTLIESCREIIDKDADDSVKAEQLQRRITKWFSTGGKLPKKPLKFS